MTVSSPQVDAGVMARRAEIVAALRRIVPGQGVIATEDAMRPYESDGLTAYRQLPMVVVLPNACPLPGADLFMITVPPLMFMPR